MLGLLIVALLSDNAEDVYENRFFDLDIGN